MSGEEWVLLAYLGCWVVGLAAVALISLLDYRRHGERRYIEGRTYGLTEGRREGYLKGIREGRGQPYNGPYR